MKLEELRKELWEMNPDMVILDEPSFDKSIIGYSSDDRAIYDFEKMVSELASEDNITEEEAQEFIEYNTLRAIGYMGENKPIILFKLID